MEALFIRNTGKLFVSDTSAPRPFYCPTTPHRLNFGKGAAKPKDGAVVAPCPTTRSPSQRPSRLPSSDLVWDLKTPQTSGVAVASLSPSTIATDSPTYNESWPSCSEQTPPTSNSQAPPTSSASDRVLPLERALEFEKREEEEGRPSLARFVERFRKAPPTRREDRGREFSWELQSQSTPGSEVKCHTTPQSSTTGSPSYVEASPHVSENSLESRSQGLIDRGSSLISSSSSTDSSLTTKNYFNTNRQSSGKASKGVAPAKPHPPPAVGSGPLCPEDDILYQWRLRRRLEEARQEAWLVSKQSKQFHPQPGKVKSLLSPIQPSRLASSDGSYLAVCQTQTRTGMTGLGARLTGTGTGLTRIESGQTSLETTSAGDPEMGVDGGKPHPTQVGVVKESEERDLTDDRGSIQLSDVCSLELHDPDRKDGLVSMETYRGRDQTLSVHHVTTGLQPTLRGAEKGGAGGTTDNFDTPSLCEVKEGQGGATNHNFVPPCTEVQERQRTIINDSTVPRLPSDRGEGPQPLPPQIEPKEETSSLVCETTPTGLDVAHRTRQTPSPCLEEVKGDGGGYDGCGHQGGGAAGESSYWTITPCGSPDSGRAHSIGPLLNEVVADRLFQHASSPPPPTPPRNTASQQIQSGHLDVDSGRPNVVSGRPDTDSPTSGHSDHHWEDDMNDDLLRLLIEKAYCFEAGIRRLDQLLSELDATDNN